MIHPGGRVDDDCIASGGESVIRPRVTALLVAGAFAAMLVYIPSGASSAGAPSIPSPRSGMGMAYDAADHQVVLFGGLNYPADSDLGDTWTWDGTQWTQ